MNTPEMEFNRAAYRRLAVVPIALRANTVLLTPVVASAYVAMLGIGWWASLLRRLWALSQKS
jgi:hypothetical protein